MRLICVFAIACGALAAQSADLSGDWKLTINRLGQPDTMRLTLVGTSNGFSGTIWGGDVTLEATTKGASVQFQCTYKEDEKEKTCGSVTGELTGDTFQGSGKLFDDDVEFAGVRERVRNTPPQTHEFVPVHYYRQFSGLTEPALRVNPGDTVRTKCVDAGGVNEKGEHKSPGGNPLNGPFYIEGALPGDTLVVKLNRVRLNRDSAGIFNDTVVGSAVEPYYFRDLKRVKDFDSSWALDRANGTAALSKPTEHLRNLKVPLRPMMGCIGVAPPNRQVYQSGNLGDYGGNMDYNQIREGTTVYLPVFQTGALLFIGDGHAAQGDGELTGNALETSMDVEFTVDLVRGKSLGRPRFENAEDVMVSGIAGSLQDALQEATTGMSRWLANEYKLNAGEIAMVLGSSMRYDVAEVVDPKVHVVARLPKSILGQIAAGK